MQDKIIAELEQSYADSRKDHGNVLLTKLFLIEF